MGFATLLPFSTWTEGTAGAPSYDKSKETRKVDTLEEEDEEGIEEEDEDEEDGEDEEDDEDEIAPAPHPHKMVEAKARLETTKFFFMDKSS